MTGETSPETQRSNEVRPGTDPHDRLRDALLIGLTLASGVVDAVSYLGLGHIFTANMTGNVIFLALALGELSFPTAVRSAVALIVFSLGALAAGRILTRVRPTVPRPGQLAPLLWGELGCMVAFALIWGLSSGEPGTGTIYLLIALSSFGMGLQNSAARHSGVPGLTTTVLTGALTNFMFDLPAVGISGTSQRRAGWTILALFTGAAIGATLLVYARVVAPLVTVVTVATVAVLAYTYFGRTSKAVT